MKVYRSPLLIETGTGITLHDLTGELRRRLADCGVRQGFVTVSVQIIGE